MVKNEEAKVKRVRYDYYCDDNRSDYNIAKLPNGDRFFYTEMCEHGKTPVCSDESMYVMTLWEDTAILVFSKGFD